MQHFSFRSELREDNCPPPAYIVEGVKALISALRTWLKREVRVGHSVPTVISVHHHLQSRCCYTAELWASVEDVTTVASSYLLDVCQWPTTEAFLFTSPVWMCCAVALQVNEPSSEVPDNIRPNHLIKELTKEIRYLEVRKDEWYLMHRFCFTYKLVPEF